MDSEERQARLAALAEQIAGVQAASAPTPEVAGADGNHAASRSEHDQAAAARAICLRLLAVAPRPRAGLAQALARKDIPDTVAEAVLDRLTEVGLIDDVAYANSFVRIKHRDRALGRTALRVELRKHGVDEVIVTGAVEAVDPAAEQARAAALVHKRIDGAMAAGPAAARRRLIGLLARRGYPPDVTSSVVDTALEAYVDEAMTGS